MKVSVSKLKYDPEFNCRGDIDPASCQELADSIASIGLLNPLTVTTAEPPFKWRIVAGHRRYLAVKILGWEKVEVTVRDITNTEAQRINLQENLGRKDLTPTQEMRSIIRIYGRTPNKKQVASELGKCVGWVRERLAMRFLDDKILAEVDNGSLTAVDVCLILSEKPEHQLDLAMRLKQMHTEGFSTAAAKLKLRKRHKSRTAVEIQGAITALSDLGNPPSWWSAMSWCAGKTKSEDFFGVKLSKLREYGITD